jgi:transposase
MKKQKPKANTVIVDHRNIVGIDIGKRKHAATAVTPKGAIIASLRSFDNNQTGVDLLERQVLIPATGKSKPRIAMEATGQYWNALHDELQRRGYPCVVLNPIQTGNRGSRRIRKTKTDPADSDLIARTILAGDAQATLVPDESIFELRLLVRHRWRMIRVHGAILRYAIGLLDRVFPECDGIFCKPFITSIRALVREVGLTPKMLVANKEKAMKTLVKASRKRLTAETINELLKRAEQSIGTRQGDTVINAQFRMVVDYLDFVESQIQTINKELKERMKAMDSPLMSLGIGAVVAATILAESGDITRFPGPGEYSAFCGLDPSVRDSGDSVRGISHISKRGSTLLRWALYMSAPTMVTKHKDFAKIYERHLNQKKGHRFSMIAVAHKLARVIWRLYKDGRSFTKRPPKRLSKK